MNSTSVKSLTKKPKNSKAEKKKKNNKVKECTVKYFKR